VEKNLSPLSKVISSLVEVTSLMETTSPLNKLVISGNILYILLGSKVSVVELLLPTFHLLDAKFDNRNINYNLLIDLTILGTKFNINYLFVQQIS
jgi:hypothetical protein